MTENIVPQLSEHVERYPFDNGCYMLHETFYDYRIKVSKDMITLLDFVNDNRTIEEIVALYNQEHAMPLTQDMVYRFLFENLGKYGIIRNTDLIVEKSKSPDYLKLNFIVINARKVSAVTKHINFFFKKSLFLSFLLAGILMISITSYANWETILSSEISLSNSLFFLLFSFIGVTIHEFGHAAAAHHFGAKHGGIGGGFYMFSPVYFADVSDIWKLPKRQRIIVNLAGVYFEIIYSTMGILIALLTANPVLLVFCCLFSFYTLYNLNPFLRSDGYWVLADILSRPNLLKDSLKMVWRPSSIDGFSLGSALLFTYGLISYLLLGFFLYIVLVQNPDSILFFWRNLTTLFNDIFVSGRTFNIKDVGNIVLPILFFYLVIKFSSTLFKSPMIKARIGRLVRKYSLRKSD